MMLYALAAVLLTIWLVSLLFGKGGFIHILLLSAIAVFAIEAAHQFRARRVEGDFPGNN